MLREGSSLTIILYPARVVDVALRGWVLGTSSQFIYRLRACARGMKKICCINDDESE